MSNSTLLYWLTRLDGLVHFFGFFAIVSGVAMVAIIIIFLSLIIPIHDVDSTKWQKEKAQQNLDTWRKCYKVARIFVYIIFTFSLLVSLFVPNREEALIIIVGSKAMNWAQQDTSLAKIPGQTTKIITDYLDKTLKLVEEKKK